MNLLLLSLWMFQRTKKEKGRFHMHCLTNAISGDISCKHPSVMSLRYYHILFTALQMWGFSILANPKRHYIVNFPAWNIFLLVFQLQTSKHSKHIKNQTSLSFSIKNLWNFVQSFNWIFPSSCWVFILKASKLFQIANTKNK